MSWSISRAAVFENARRNYKSQLIRRLKQPDLTDFRAKKILDRIDNFDRFRTMLDEFEDEEDDPQNHLEPACDEQGIPIQDYYLIGSASLEAYVYRNAMSPSAIFVLFCNAEDRPKRMREALAEARRLSGL